MGREHSGETGEGRPVPTMVGPQTVAPGVVVGAAAPAVPPPAPIRQAQRPAALAPRRTDPSAQPGFNF
jgi:hypothetical protein